jgi:aryl-alcohol dehydrogenase-like predicted oxidoreductase
MNHKITIGNREITRVGLGTNRLTDTIENRAFLNDAVAAGLQFIDTAYLYTDGASETTIGSTLAPFPESLVVATKGNYHGGGSGQLRHELGQSVQRLGVDQIFLYYLHRVDPETPLEESVGVLAEFVAACRISHIGLSEVSIEEIERARSVAPIAAVQNEFSLGERKHEEVIDYCEREGIAFVPFFPLRGSSPALAGIAKRHDATENQIKIAWLLKRSPAMAPIPGTLSLEHLKENLAALEIELSDDEYEALSG